MNMITKEEFGLSMSRFRHCGKTHLPTFKAVTSRARSKLFDVSETGKPRFKGFSQFKGFLFCSDLLCIAQKVLF